MAKPPKTPPLVPTTSDDTPFATDGSLISPARADSPPRAGALGADSLRVEAGAGSASLKIEVNHTPAGLLALGACVTSILLGAAAIVWISTSPARQHPIATAWTLRRKP